MPSNARNLSSFSSVKTINDISTLALRQSSNENKEAYNSNSMYVDVFQDSTGITNLTNCSRDSSEFVSSATAASFASNNSTLITSMTQIYNFDNAVTDALGNQDLINSGVTFNSSTKKLGTHSAYFDGGATTEFSYDDGSGSADVPHYFNSFPPSALSMSCWVYWTPNNNNWNMILDNYHVSDANKRNVIFAVGNDDSGTSYHDYPSIYSDTGGTVWHSSSQAVSHSTWTHITWSLTTSLKRIYINGVERLSQSGTFTFDSTANDDGRIGGRASNGDFQYRGYIDQLALWTRELTATDAGHLYNSGSGNAFTPATANATGSFESNAITSSASISKMGAIITYQDNSGTNALNTDIVLKLSADNGSNYSTATLVAMPDFASGIKMAKVNNLSVTSGTQLKYKLEFANQSLGSKEARIRGVSLQF